MSRNDGPASTASLPVSRALCVIKDKAVIKLQSVDRIEVLNIDALSSLDE